MVDVNRVLASTEQLRRVVQHARGVHDDLRWKQEVPPAQATGAKDVLTGVAPAFEPEEARDQHESDDRNESDPPERRVALGENRVLHRVSVNASRKVRLRSLLTR